MTTTAPILVRCPFCNAGEGFPCKVAGRQRYGFFHPMRSEAARGTTMPPRRPDITVEWP